MYNFVHLALNTFTLLGNHHHLSQELFYLPRLKLCTC